MYVHLLYTSVKVVLTTSRCRLMVFITILMARIFPTQGIHPSHRFLPEVITTTMIRNQSLSLNTPNTQDILSISILHLNQPTTLPTRIQVGSGQLVRHFNVDGHAVSLTMEDLLATVATMRKALLT
jgi:hypothetical protein